MKLRYQVEGLLWDSGGNVTRKIARDLVHARAAARGEIIMATLRRAYPYALIHDVSVREFIVPTGGSGKTLMSFTLLLAVELVIDPGTGVDIAPVMR